MVRHCKCKFIDDIGEDSYEGTHELLLDYVDMVWIVERLPS